VSPALREAARRRDLAAWAGPLHVASLVGAFLFLLWVNRRQWFNLDEWNFLIDRHAFAGDGVSIWEPHNEHWSTTPVLLYRGMFAVFGVRTYLPYLLVNIGFHLLVVHLLWRVMRRNGVEPLLATCACAVLAVFGAGWENLIAAFQYQFFGPLVFGLLALLVVPEQGGLARRDVLVIALLVVGLTFSGTGITMVVVVTLVALIRRGLLVAAVTAAVPAAVYGVWYLAYGRDGTVDVPQLSFDATLKLLPSYVWHGLVSAVDGYTGLAGVGAVALVLLGVVVVRSARPAPSAWTVPLAMTLGAVTFLTLTGSRRAGLGVATAGAARYVYVVTVLLLPLMALAIDRATRRRPMRLWILVGLTAVFLIVQTTLLNTEANDWADIEQEQKDRIVAAAQLAREGERFVFQAPVPQFIPNLTIDEIATLDRDGKLPGNVEVSEADVLTARAYLQLDLAERRNLRVREPLPRLGSIDGVEALPTADPACVRLEPTSSRPAAVVDFAVPGSIGVTSDLGGRLLASVRDQSGGEGRPRPFTLREGQRRVLNVTAAGFSVQLVVPAQGATRLCGLQPAAMAAA
jgi:hypothetical protein